MLSEVHGRATPEELAEVTGVDLKDVLRIARRLVDLGALQVEGEPAKTKRPPGPKRTERPAARSETPVAATATSLIPPALVPVARPCDVRSLGIGAREGFVLSQIDGATSAEDLVQITHPAAARAERLASCARGRGRGGARASEAAADEGACSAGYERSATASDARPGGA